MRDEKLYVRDIAECIERIESYTRGGREAFMQTRMIRPLAKMFKPHPNPPQGIGEGAGFFLLPPPP